METSNLIDLLHDMFYYYEGNLIRLTYRAPNAKAGDKAGYVSKADGYTRVNIDGKNYLLHRLIFLMHNNYIPKYIDHIDGDKSNNRIENLREATSNQNNYNGKPISKTSKYRGVSKDHTGGKWLARVHYKGKRYHIGLFTEEHKAALEVNRWFMKNLSNADLCFIRFNTFEDYIIEG